MTGKFKSSLAKFLKTFIPLVFGLFVLWLILFKILDFNEIMQIVKQDVNFWIIALSLPFGLFANIMRAYRWDLLIRPLGFRAKKSNLIYAVLGTYGVNLAVPRLGEVWRCTMISRYEKIPFTKLIGTMLTDRLSDTIAVASIVIAAFAMNVPYFRAFFVQHPETFDALSAILTSFWTYAILLLLVLTGWLCFFVFKENKIIKKTRQTLTGIWEGIFSIGQMKEKSLFFFYTFLIWIGYYLYFYICFFAFPFTESLGWNKGLIAFGMSSVAVAVPVQGGIGAWHAMVIAVLMGFGISSIDAGAFAFCVHTIQALIFTAAFGLFGVLALPFANKGK
ncbi:dolichol-P-glucose synthetase [Bacteroidia bacterium]|nr:dolichol-P-glucose synthetase [Bacteroidia bacterium]